MLVLCITPLCPRIAASCHSRYVLCAPTSQTPVFPYESLVRCHSLITLVRQWSMHAGSCCCLVGVLVYRYLDTVLVVDGADIAWPPIYGLAVV